MTADPVPVMTAEQVESLANEIITNAVYLPSDERQMNDAFMCILALIDELPPNAGWLCERWDKAGPRSVNGQPSFFSCKIIPKENMDALNALLREKAELLGLTESEDE